MDSRPRLSCEQCRRRKTKCDKAYPCSACKSSGLHCELVQRARLPRGRSGKGSRRKEALESRILKIERLLAEVADNDHHEDAGNPKTSVPVSSSSGTLGSYVASEFWERLSVEISGIRNVFDEDSADEEDSPPGLINSNISSTQGFAPIIFTEASTVLTAQTPPFPGETRETLLDLYHDRVDLVFKVGHWPTMVRMIEASHDSESAGSPSRALENSILFLASCTITEEECIEIIPNESKRSLMQRYRTAAETELKRCNVLQRPNLLSLQAFVIYLKGLRACQCYATTWTLISIAVRLADIMGLGKGDDRTLHTVDRETRRRLWYCINLMDIQSALDRGTTPLIPEESLGPMPLNISDDQMYNIEPSPQDQTCANDEMSFSILCYEAMVCQKRLCKIPSDTGADVEEDTKMKLDLVADLQRTFESRYIPVPERASQLQLMASSTANTILLRMQLGVRRPPYPQTRNSVAVQDDFDFMEAAATIVDRELHDKVDRFKQWSWKVWPPWFALAILLAELCDKPTKAESDRAFALACEAYRRFGAPVDDLESGMLWRPIAKLMRRAVALRQDNGNTGSGFPTSNLPPSIPSYWNTMAYPSSTTDLHLKNRELGSCWPEGELAWMLTSRSDVVDADNPNPTLEDVWPMWEAALDGEMNGLSTGWSVII